MKLLGIVLILLGALGGFLNYRRSAMQTLQLSRAFTDDLAILRCQICIHRKPLPSVLSHDLARGMGSTAFWLPLGLLLDKSDRSVRACWEKAASELPEPLNQCLFPLGALLPVGGDTLACAIDEVRHELMDLTARQQAQEPLKLRLAAAMFFCMASLFVLVCA